MVIMAVDYGDVRTGIAVSDKLEILASPVCTINERNPDRLIEKISELSESYAVNLFIVGLPKNMDSSLGERAEKCSDFAKALSEKTGIPHLLRDERLTTVSAHNVMNDNNVRGKKRKEQIDQVSAVLILQDYLDSGK